MRGEDKNGPANEAELRQEEDQREPRNPDETTEEETRKPCSKEQHEQSIEEQTVDQRPLEEAHHVEQPPRQGRRGGHR